MLRTKTKMLEFVIGLMLIVSIAAEVQSAGVAIFEDDFTDVPAITCTKSGFTWIGFGLNVEPDVVSPPTSLALAASGGSGLAYGYFLWDIGGTYDFFSNGTATCSLWVSRFTTSSWIRAELLNSNLQQLAVAEYQFATGDYNVFHELVVPMDGDETNVRYVRFTIWRPSGTAMSKCRVDNFRVEIPINSCGDNGTVYLPGDFNLDCQVDMKDLAMLASNWLSCNDPMDVNCD